jgi:hypothetical protein
VVCGSSADAHDAPCFPASASLSSAPYDRIRLLASTRLLATVTLSEPGGELREALEDLWNDWQSTDPGHLMHYNDFLAPEIESTLRMTFRFFVRSKFPPSIRPSEHEMDAMIEEWVEQFAITLRDKRPDWRDRMK